MLHATFFDDIRSGDSAEAAAALARLTAVRALLLQMAGGEAPTSAGLDPHEAACRYAVASPIARRRFDALVAETAGFTAEGIAALLAAPAAASRRPAAGQLEAELRRAMTAMARVLGL